MAIAFGQEARYLRAVCTQSRVNNPIQRDTTGCGMAVKRGRYGHIAEGSQRGHDGGSKETTWQETTWQDQMITGINIHRAEHKAKMTKDRR
jgi:hypothetical protein